MFRYSNDENKFEADFIEFYDKGINMSENMLEQAVSDYSVEESCGENGRWTCDITTICQIKERYFSISWERGLTEYQDDFYPWAPEEVKPVIHNRKIYTVIADYGENDINSNTPAKIHSDISTQSYKEWIKV